MTTKEVWTVDYDKVYWTHELPIWAKCSVVCRIWDEEWEVKEKTVVAEFTWMDWYYWHWVDEEWDSLIFNWYFKLINEDKNLFELYTAKEVGLE